MEEEIRRLESSLENLSGRLGRMGSSEALSRRNGLEATYGQTYQALVRLGARPQIRKKYRKAQ